MDLQQIQHRLKILKATFIKGVEEATFLENELTRFYGSAPKKAQRKKIDPDVEAKILNDFRAKTINKKALAGTKAG